ncbi:mfs multidrug [Moniliophthora roreri MCA 2997]|uniref:Mfs multidrug n=1 Tax=Moniliophthora roreri (strain MCA 2997) TaxID=1381753 RepID=V2X941_MONRO|nr:mfs multidrug [Moniliophthora roreri MCA 2997]
MGDDTDSRQISDANQMTPFSRLTTNTNEKTQNHSLTNITNAPETSSANRRPSVAQKDTGLSHAHGLDLSVAAPPEGIEERQASITVSEQVTIVDWDGPDDPANPKNWKNSRKWAATLIVACFTFISPVASSMIAPATDNVAKEFNVTSKVILNMITSMFILGFAVGPLVIGPLSEVFGRSRTLQLANLFFLCWNFVCGFARTPTQLIIFRFLAGVGGSAPLSIGGAVIGDTFHPEERGRAIALYALGPMIGPAVGGVGGAWIAEGTNWRWVFWSTSIFDVIIQIAGILYLQETYAPVLLERKARRMANAQVISDSVDNSEKGEGAKKSTAVETGHKHFRTIYDGSVDRSWQRIVSKALTRPFILFAREPILQLLGSYMAFMYGVFYIFVTTMPTIFQGIYSQSIGIAGLNYIALGLGLTSASFLNSRIMDKIYLYCKKRNNDIGEPEFRVPILIPASILLPTGLLLSGWAAQKALHWIVADIGIFMIGFSMILAFQCIQIFVVDVFTLYAASGFAAIGCLRALFGFGFPLFSSAMYNSLGLGVGNTVLAAVAIVVGCPAPFIFWVYGKRIRARSKYAR